LRSERSILVTQSTNIPNKPQTYGQLLSNVQRFSTPISDPQLAELICDLMISQMTGLPDLVDLEQHNFVTAEDRKFDAQQKLARSGVRAAYFGSVIALVIAFLTFGFSFLTGKGAEKKTDQITDAATRLITSLEQISNSMHGIESSLDTITELDASDTKQMSEIQLEISKQNDDLVKHIGTNQLSNFSHFLPLLLKFIGTPVIQVRM